VIPSGKQSKIFVPREQTVDLAHRDQLLAVPVSQRPAAAWEGSAWTGASDVADSDMLRCALVVPRLIAPHPHASAVEATPERYLATLTLGRIDELRPGQNWIDAPGGEAARSAARTFGAGGRSRAQRGS